MVTNFMDIPDAVQPSANDLDTKDEGVNAGAAGRTSSVAYSNVGTFHTPERGTSISPSRQGGLMKDVILENMEEEELTPESGEISSKN